jgi:hypothetical protein
MPKKLSSRDLSGADLTTATAEKIFGWKNVHKHNGELIGKKQEARALAFSEGARLLRRPGSGIPY